MNDAPRLLQPEDALLIVVDIQEKLIGEIHEAGRVVARSRRMIEGAQALGLPVLVTEQYPRGLGPTTAVLSDAIAGLPVLEKTTFGCTGTPEIVAAVLATGRRTLVLVGIEAHVCVTQTALGAMDMGYRVHVVADAVGSRDPHNREIGLERMRQAGAEITSSEMALFELLRDSRSPHFRAILQLVR